MGVWLTFYRECQHMTRQRIEGADDRRIDAQGRCPECVRAPRPRPRQNEPTGRRCPECGGEVLLMTRLRDLHRFYACRNYYAPAIRCRYTADHDDGGGGPAVAEATR